MFRSTPPLKLLARIGSVIFALALTLALGGSTLAGQTLADRIGRLTFPVEFDFLTWTVTALAEKTGAAGLRATDYLADADRRQVVLEYLDTLVGVHQLRADLETTLADPTRENPEGDAADIRIQLRQEARRLDRLRPLAESALQEQVALALGDSGIGLAGVPFPPVVFNFAPLPSSLIVSPREVIRQEASISLKVDLTLEQKIQLERRVEQALNVSALVVPVGGLGTYPTMVQESADLRWIAEVVAHEWTHNYLALRPLGWRYGASPEMRTINETVASLIGEAIARRVLETCYPERLPPPPAPTLPAGPPPQQEEPPTFDFRAEMRETRLRVDALLAEGKIEEAERYMEARRLVFWEHGYHIRRLNQAYFAFHGAYADEPGGPAGDDPVGEAVRQLWARIASPAEFLRLVSRVRSFEELQGLLISLP